MTEKDKVETLSDRIWNKISKLDLELFALPNQALEKHAKRVAVTATEVHLKIAVSAVLPALEDAVRRVKVDGKPLTIEQHKQFTVIALAQDN